MGEAPARPTEATERPKPETEPTPADRDIAIGIWVKDVPWDLSRLDSHQAIFDYEPAIVHLFWSWDETNYEPDMSLFRDIRDRGATPLLTWMPYDHRSGHDQPAFSLEEILTGRYDGFIRAWAREFAAYEDEILLRFAHEMNGHWYPWNAGINGNTPEQFVALWRHVHGIFARAGADNVRWVWSPNVQTTFVPTNDPALFFPGDDYIDWIGLSGFNNADWGYWLSFEELFHPTYLNVISISARPVLLAEVGTTEGNEEVGGDKGEWIREMYLESIPELFPTVEAVLWFDEDKSHNPREGDYSLGSSEDAMRAYRDVISSGLYSTHFD